MNQEQKITNLPVLSLEYFIGIDDYYPCLGRKSNGL
jgi:hypothetical protein